MDYVAFAVVALVMLIFWSAIFANKKREMIEAPAPAVTLVDPTPAIYVYYCVMSDGREFICESKYYVEDRQSEHYSRVLLGTLD